MSDMLRSTAAMALSFLGGSLLGAQNPPIPTRDSVESVVRSRVAVGGSTGLAVGVVRPVDEFAVFVGEERVGTPIDAATIFEIGSITKAFTGILLADMVNRGEVRLDQPVADLLPAGTRVPTMNGAVITLEHLATHTSGLPRLPANLRPADPSNPYADYSVAQLYEFLRGHELQRAPGARYEYSNLGAGLLGHALAIRGGATYEQLVRERILGPLGMTNTAITLTPPMRRRLTQGHDADGSPVPHWDIPTLAGAGALRSTLADMLKFAAAVRTPPDNEIGRAIMLSTRARVTPNRALQLGLGWHISNFNGDTIVWHNGGTAGFRTMVAVNPARNVGMVLLGTSSQDNDDIVRHFLMGLPLPTGAARTEIALPTDTLRSYVGRYEFAPTFAIDVTLQNGALFAQPTGQQRFRIYAEALDRFFLRVVVAQLEFNRDASGAVTSVTLVQNGRQVGRKVR